MSEDIHHECGLAFIRLLKPFSYYQQQYGSAFYGLNKLYLLMEKQHNRGQDGAGIAVVKLHTPPGYPMLHRIRSNAQQPIPELFRTIFQEVEDAARYQPHIQDNPDLLKGHVRFMGELLLGHLRYGTQGKNHIELCHPFIHIHEKPALNLAMAGNFNLINTDELFAHVGVTPDERYRRSDLAAMMEVMYHYLQEDVQNHESPNLPRVLCGAFSLFDGGYTAAGLLGTGDSFVIRDPHGIRPAYYYANEEIVVAASERAAIRTCFNLEEDMVKELMPGKALLVNAAGEISEQQILPAQQRRACSFERIYFSRGNDEKIYQERKKLGYTLSEIILKAIDYDLKHTIFSFIPNTAEVAFYGLIQGLEDYLNQIKVQRILSWGNDMDPNKLAELISRRVRIEKIAIKDVKLRTFIAADQGRTEMVQHVYDITYGTVQKGIDTLVVIDDSIVRGTTLRESIIKMLDRLGPRRIIIVSSAPQIRYPDCYGIDMSKLGDFVAFRAAIELLKEKQKTYILEETYSLCKQLQRSNSLHAQNVVKHIYKPFTVEEISQQIARIITPPGTRAEVSVIYQSIENLHLSCPNNLGDWYFTGNYPTPGGNKVVNQAFLNFMEGKNERGY
ncbi:MAG: amidophosphoribosyltransferase [Thermoflavifilum sp.]|nr:amidophosphoribosyltransferase [Thermoflavifilum sp.]